MPKDNILNNKEGENMLAKKKDNLVKDTDATYVPAKTEDVVKAIMKSNKKHKKMMSMLSK